jgi:hypothetical protein
VFENISTETFANTHLSRCRKNQQQSSGQGQKSSRHDRDAPISRIDETLPDIGCCLETTAELSNLLWLVLGLLVFLLHQITTVGAMNIYKMLRN